MAANPYLPHLLVLPEDDANRQLANGFIEHYGLIAPRQVQVLPVAGGWQPALHILMNDLIPKLRVFPQRHIVLLIDFDGSQLRRATVAADVPVDLRTRVFILGVKSNPEKLRSYLGMSLEAIGLALATDCLDETMEVWGTPLLSDNVAELSRLRPALYGLLFGLA